MKTRSLVVAFAFLAIAACAPGDPVATTKVATAATVYEHVLDSTTSTTTTAPTTTTIVVDETTTVPPPPPPIVLHAQAAAVEPVAPPPPPDTEPAPQPEGGSAYDAVMQWFPDNFDSAWRVSGCESGHNPSSVSSGGGNWGLFQINTVHRSDFEAVTGHPWSDVLDAFLNAQYARHLYDASGWGPWTCKWAA